MTDTVRHGDVATVSDGMAFLDRLPGCPLQLPAFRFFAGMPTDRRGIKKNLGALHGSQPGRFRIPLVPADQHPDFRIARLPSTKAQVPRSEVKFFVIKWI